MSNMRNISRPLSPISSGSLILAKIKLHQLLGGHGSKGVSLSCIAAELKFKGIVLPFFDYCPYFAAPQILLGQIFKQSYHIKKFNFVHYSFNF